MNEKKNHDLLNIVFYHKNCMDGLASAYIARESFKTLGAESVQLPINYGQEEEIFKSMEEIKNQFDLEKNCVNILIVDFSIDADIIDKLLEEDSIVNEVVILDHHKGAKEKLENYQENNPDKAFEFYFNNEQSGATITYDYFENIAELDKTIFEYVEDRDLWKWNLEDSREVSAFLQHTVELNNIDSFDVAYAVISMLVPRREAVTIGKTIVNHIDKIVKEKTEEAETVIINGVPFKCINANTYVSELGNALCDKYELPSAMYRLDDQLGTVEFSLRSKNELPSVLEIAKEFKGGGHRNSCGFTTSLGTLAKILHLNVEGE